MITHPDYSFIANAGEHSGHGVVLLDLSTGKPEYINERFLSIFELSHESLFDLPSLIAMVHEEDMEYLKTCYQQLLKSGIADDVEFRIDVNGGVKHVHCFIAVLQKDHRFTAFVKDISDQKHHEDYLIRYSAQKDTMLDMLTHNLSGSLQLSQGLIQSMEKEMNGTANGKARHLELIRENTKQCIDIVNDFLRKEHYESLSTDIRVTRFDLSESISVIIEKLRELNPDKSFVFKPMPGPMNSDAVKFFQVMHNVLSNSIKFTGEGGRIEVEVEEQENHYWIKVKDNGIGIPDIIRPMIFKGRVMGRTGLKGEKSSGLGLSIAARLLKLMNGRIWFESEEEKGSVFYIELPKELHHPENASVG